MILPGIEFMLLGDRKVTEQDIADLKAFTIKIVSILFLSAISFVTYVHIE